MPMSLIELPIWSLCLGAVAAVLVGKPAGEEAKVAGALRKFVGTLTEAQKQACVFTFDSEERFNWHFIPRERKGIAFKSMSDAQRKAAVEVLKASLSRGGYEKAETIRSLEAVLKEIEKGSGPVRDPENYYFSVFGEPSPTDPWGWRYEGHHISLQWTAIGGKVVASTPQFFGANPGEVREGPLKGTRALAVEEDLGRALVAALNDSQRAKALLSATAPADILTSAQRSAAIQEDKGVAYSELDSAQRKQLMDLIRAYASAQPAPLMKARLARVKAAGYANIKFGWMGGTAKGDPHYYRVQGKTFLIEYDNTQNNANHIHAVWRDFKGDFGADLLAEHYRSAPKEHGHEHH